MTDPISEKSTRCVALVFAPNRTRFTQTLDDCGFRNSEQRPQVNPALRHRLNRAWSSQPSKSAPPSKSHEHRFGHVVLLMSKPKRMRAPMSKLTA
jgi:hypothetical protein